MSQPQNLRELFEATLALHPAQRVAFLARCCPDAGQRAAVASLVEADADWRGRLLDRPLESMLERIEDAEAAQLPAPGGTIGPFTLLDKLGEGGASIVYRACREQDGVRQTVALKLLRRGVYSRDEQRQFRRERLALAQLEHPGIARLIEGGIAATGVPYIALELVDGAPITEHVRAQRLDLRRRLALFAQVCRVVEAAHRALIVHRDLKPSNVLVSRDGAVKLLDFGIAKLLDAQAPDDTRTAQCALTPAYAAPEQFTHGLVTTATDVYALGVLLGELLAGERAARGDERPPSARIDPRAAPGALPGTPEATRRRLRGDLDNIVLKATAREPQQRYASAGAFADDIERHLAGRPIAAHPPSRRYRARKFIARHRAAVCGALAIALALLIAFAATLRQSRLALAQAQRADAVQAFLVDVFQTNSSYQTDQSKARATTAQQLLELGARKIDTQLDDAPDTKLQLLLLLGDMHGDLGLNQQAAALFRKAADLAHAAHGAWAPEAFAAQIRLADALHSADSDDEAALVLAQARETLARNADDDARRRAQLADQFAQFNATRDLPRALDYARQAVALYERAGATAELGFALSRKARVEHQSGLDADAIASYRRAIALSQRADGTANPDLVRYYAELSELEYAGLDIPAGERDARDALRLARAIHGEDHVDVVQCEMRLGRLLFDTGREQEGLALIASAKRKALALLGPDEGFHTPQMLYQNGAALVRTGRVEDGLADLQAAIANRRRNRPGTIPLAQFLESAALAEIELGRFGAAARDLDESDAIRSKAGQASPSRAFDENVSLHMQLALAQDDTPGAAKWARQLSAPTRDGQPMNLRQIANTLVSARLRLAMRDPDAAVALARAVRADMSASAAAPYYRRHAAMAQFIEGAGELARGRPGAAIPLLREALRERQETLHADSAQIAEAQIALARAEALQGDADDARRLMHAAAAIAAKHVELGVQYRKPLQDLQAALVPGFVPALAARAPNRAKP